MVSSSHALAADEGASSPSAEWSALPRWMREQLEGGHLRYKDFLPVQSAVVPYILRGIRSCLPMDVCLSSPTGSGKTLCYLLPILHLIGEEKKELPEDTRLRAVIVVPTKALGTQVHAVLKRMTAGTNISVACTCGENPSKEAQQLVRRVELLGGAGGADHGGDDDAHNDDEAHNDDTILFHRQSYEEADDEDHRNGSSSRLLDSTAAGSGVGERTVLSTYPAGKPIYYSAADILISTPQRLLKHCGTTAGFTLRHLRMLVIDEADQILAAGANGSGVNPAGTSSSNSFTNLIGRLLQLCEPSSSSSSSSSSAPSTAAAGSAGGNRTAVLHKILCSATLSAHITRISEVRLRNVKQFSLATDGTPLEDVDAHVLQDATGPLSHFTSRFALPPKLHEHMFTTIDERRPALLLKLIRHLRSLQHVVDDEGEVVVRKTSTVGKTCVVFCAQSDTARVLATFLSKCDIDALDFTSTSSVTERRQFVISGVAGKAVVLVTTDALMRGVDLPGVGHVVMYDAPQSLPQFIHRVGRTARAMREGHAYLLLTKKGPSGTLADGEVAQYKALDKYITRTIPVVYEKELQVLTDEDVAFATTKLHETKEKLETLLLSSSSVAASPQPAKKKKQAVEVKSTAPAVTPSQHAVKRPREEE